jgi:hypothetical protein
MHGGIGARNQESNQHKQKQNNNKKRAVALICDLIAVPDAMGEQFHTASEGWVCTKATVYHKNPVASHSICVTE